MNKLLWNEGEEGAAQSPPGREQLPPVRPDRSAQGWLWLGDCAVVLRAPGIQKELKNPVPGGPQSILPGRSGNPRPIALLSAVTEQIKSLQSHPDRLFQPGTAPGSFFPALFSASLAPQLVQGRAGTARAAETQKLQSKLSSGQGGIDNVGLCNCW